MSKATARIFERLCGLMNNVDFSDPGYQVDYHLRPPRNVVHVEVGYVPPDLVDDDKVTGKKFAALFYTRRSEAIKIGAFQYRDTRMGTRFVVITDDQRFVVENRNSENFDETTVQGSERDLWYYLRQDLAFDADGLWITFEEIDLTEPVLITTAQTKK